MFWKSVSVFGSESVSPWRVTQSAFVDKGSIVKHTAPPVTGRVHATNNVVEVVCDTTSPRCYSYLFLEIPHFTMESAESIQRYLPRDTWVSSIDFCGYLFPHTHPQRLPKMSSFSGSGHHISIPGTVVYLFSSTLGILQDYDRDQNAGTRDGHQSLSVPGRLAHLFTISWPVPPRHCTSAQSLPHNGPPLSRQEVGTDPKTEIPFSGIPVRPGFLPSHSNSGSISQNQALICLFLLSQGGCAHTWQILLGLFASTEKMIPLEWLHTCEAQHCISHQCFNQNLWILLSPMAEEDFQWRKSAHNVLRGALVTLTNQTLSCSRMHRTSAGEHIGMHWRCPVYGQQPRKHFTSMYSS